ncbi:unnamed protein product [Sphagnum jensenii]|uniref:Uncharacterized protein n=1 Tax=Sphagnum jensenii TaxID=128206 RepID=A0ABP0ZZ90_9BRYO
MEYAHVSDTWRIFVLRCQMGGNEKGKGLRSACAVFLCEDSSAGICREHQSRTGFADRRAKSSLVAAFPQCHGSSGNN